MWVERVMGITGVISPPAKKKMDGLVEQRMIRTKRGSDAELQARFYLGGLALTLNNTTIYCKDLEERDRDVNWETFSLLLLPCMRYNTRATPAGQRRMCNRLALRSVRKILGKSLPKHLAEGEKLGREVLTI